MNSKEKQNIKRYQTAYKALLRQSDIVTARFVFIVNSVETELKQQLARTLSNVAGMENASIQFQVDAIIADASRSIKRTILNPLKKSSDSLWRVDDEDTIRKAVALLVLRSSSLAWALSDIVGGKKMDKEILVGSRTIMQDALARRLKNYAIAFDTAIRDWAFVSVQHPISVNKDSNVVLARAVKDLSSDKSPFRIGNLSPEERIKQMSGGETALGFFATIAAVAAVAKQDNPDAKLMAASIAIHDDKTAEDSLEAEALTANWVEYPDPYLEITDFRRRPNDRCMDVIMQESDLESGSSQEGETTLE